MNVYTAKQAAIVIKTDISDAARKFSTPYKVIKIILGYTKLILCFMDPAGSLFIYLK